MEKIEKLINDFKLLRDHCILIRQNYNTYTDLYNEENRDLLSKVAPTFFSDIAEIMHRDGILQACKLMDQAETRHKEQIWENITIKLINKQLIENGLSTSEIENITKEILDYGDKIKPARHKRITHYDREHQVNNITLGETTENELFDFLKNIQLYCNLVGSAIGIGALDFSVSCCSGDALDLIKYLKNGEN